MAASAALIMIPAVAGSVAAAQTSSHLAVGGASAVGMAAAPKLALVAGAVGVGVLAGYLVSKSPTGRSAAKLALGAALFAPMLAAEDLLRAAGADIPKEGVFCNNEGKSIWQIWNESAAK